MRQIERLVTEKAFEYGFIRPINTAVTGADVVIIGSGPSGLAAAQYLRENGHAVTVYEKNAGAGGLLRYGIPDFKLDKSIIDRRIKVMKASGITFCCNTEVGKDISPLYLLERADALILTIGTPEMRELAAPGRELKGIYQALEYLTAQNRFINGEADTLLISAKDKKVLIIGGGDTGSDCLGTAIRQGASEVTQIDIVPEPPPARGASTPWPLWPYQLKTSSSHKEGGKRCWGLMTKSFTGKTVVEGAVVTSLEWEFSPKGSPVKFKETGGERIIEADLVLLAMGFTGVAEGGICAELGLMPERGRLAPVAERKIFTAGDTRTGQSLVVRAITDALEQARKVDLFLK